MNALQKWRAHARVTQAEAAERFGVTQQAWCRWENGRVPRRQFAQRIVDGTKNDKSPITFADFYGGQPADGAAA